MHRANGGYLVIDAREVLINPFVWDSLKRCIRTAEIRIEDVLEQYRFMTMVSLKPEPVPLSAKIMLVGTGFTIRSIIRTRTTVNSSRSRRSLTARSPYTGGHAGGARLRPPSP